MPREFSKRNLSTETIRKMDRDDLEEELREARAEWSDDDTDDQLRDALVEAISNPPKRKHFSGPSGKTDLIQCRVYLSAAERDKQYAAAKAAGVSWSTWARRKLSAT